MADDQTKDKTNDNPDDKTDTSADKLESMFAAMEARLTSGLNQAITGMAGRITKATNAKLAELESKIVPVGNSDDVDADETIQETKQSKQAEKSNDNKTGDNELIAKMVAMEKRLADVQKNGDTQVQQLKDQLAAAELAKSAAIVRANLVNQLAPKVTDADALLTLLEATGKVKYADGQFVTEEIDGYGDKKQVAITEAVENGKSFLDKAIEGQYSYFQKARPGTGLGSEKSASNNNSGNGVNAIATDNYDAIAAAKLADQGTDALIAALSSTAKN